MKLNLIPHFSSRMNRYKMTCLLQVRAGLGCFLKGEVGFESFCSVAALVEKAPSRRTVYKLFGILANLWSLYLI